MLNVSEPRLIVVLSQASLETVKIGKAKEARYQLLNGEEHLNIFQKLKRDPATCRPDITHQCLMTLLDSPLNRAGKLQIYISTSKNVLIKVNPKVRIPRTLKRFSGLMGTNYSNKKSNYFTSSPLTQSTVMRNLCKSSKILLLTIYPSVVPKYVR